MSSNNTNGPAQPIGAIWKRVGEWGEWLSGEIELDGKSIWFTANVNKYKTQANHPDFKMFMKGVKAATPKPAATRPQPTVAQTSAPKKVTRPVAVVEEQAEENVAF